jgi:hypothetical protein
MKHTPEQLERWKQRPYSWSQHSAFQYSPTEWYNRYILGESTPGNPAMAFGSLFAGNIEFGTPMAPIDLLPEIEYKLEATLDGLPLIGFVDSYLPHTTLHEFKTGKAAWTQKRADTTGQLTFYALLLHLQHRIHPKQLDMLLQWVPTCEQPDGSYHFALNDGGHAQIHSFKTHRTMTQVLAFANEIKATRKAMEEFIHRQSLVA